MWNVMGRKNEYWKSRWDYWTQNERWKGRIGIGREEQVGWAILSRPAEILHGLRDLNNLVPEAEEDSLGLGISGNEQW